LERIHPTPGECSWRIRWGVGRIEAEAAYAVRPFRAGARGGWIKLMDNCRSARQRTWSNGALRCCARRAVVVNLWSFTVEGLSTLSVPDRATIREDCAEMAATMGFSRGPKNAAYLQLLRGRLTNRAVEAYWQEPGLFPNGHETSDRRFSETFTDLDGLADTAVRSARKMRVARIREEFRSQIRDGVPAKLARVQHNGRLRSTCRAGAL